MQQTIDTLIPVSQQRLKQPAGTEGTQVNSLLTADVKDKPRNRPLVRMKVRNRNTSVLHLPHANPVPPGEWIISCYDDEVPAVMAMVETRQDRLKDAQKQYQRMILAEAKKLTEFKGTVDELEEALASGIGVPEDMKDHIDSVLRETELSVESVFHAMMERDIRPLDSAELIKDSEHQEPKRVEQVKEQVDLANAMGTAIAAQLPAAMKAAMGEFADQLFAKLAPLLQNSNQNQGGQNRR